MKATPEDLQFIRELVHERAGVVIGGDKAYLVRSLLVPVVEAIGGRTLASLVARLEAEPNSELADEVVELLLNHETWFFRDHPVFNALRSTVLPEFEKRGRPVRFWSAACSSGQEPYSIAMVLRTWFPNLETEIWATDLSERVLHRARNGVYTQLEVNRGLPAAMLVRHFEEEGGEWRVKPQLTDMVRFRRLNLIGAWDALPEMDIVFLRNALLYFDDPMRRAVLERVHRILRPDGYLFLGSAEATFPHEEIFEVTRSGKAAFHRVRALGVQR